MHDIAVVIPHNLCECLHVEIELVLRPVCTVSIYSLIPNNTIPTGLLFQLKERNVVGRLAVMRDGVWVIHNGIGRALTSYTRRSQNPRTAFHRVARWERQHL